MKTLHPGRTWYILFALGAALVFVLGAAAWHALIDADPPGCTMNEVACLFVPAPSDLGIHLISYALMMPLMAAMFFWFSVWRNQWLNIRRLTASLALLGAHDIRLDGAVARLGLQGKVQLLESADLLSFCAFILSPRIFVSRAVVDILDDRELEALLLHERYHLENRDPLRIFIGHSIVSGLFFAPVLKDLFHRYLVRKEIAADQAAISYQQKRRGIVGALRKLLEQGDPARSGLAITAGATQELKYRIDFILGRPDKEPVNVPHLLISCVLPALSVLGAVLPRVLLR